MIKSNRTISGRVINVCYPRSGHRFLRNILLAYFGDDLKFHSVHINRKQTYSFDDSNFIKNHDFQLKRTEKRPVEYCQDFKYVIQYRHPLMAITSYYELALKHDRFVDSEKRWFLFLETNLAYWKKFIDKWHFTKSNVFHISYESLNENTFEVIKNLMPFIANDEMREADLNKAIATQKKGILRYIEDEERETYSHPRRLIDFKYYDEKRFKEIENALTEKYLDVTGIKKIMSYAPTAQ